MPPNDLIIVNAKVKTLDQKNLAARMCQERCAAAGLVNAWCDKRSRMRAATIFTSFHFAPSQKHRLVITRCGRAWCVGDDGEATDAATSTAVAASRTTAQMQVLSFQPLHRPANLRGTSQTGSDQRLVGSIGGAT